jgi:hypothetical protein
VANRMQHAPTRSEWHVNKLNSFSSVMSNTSCASIRIVVFAISEVRFRTVLVAVS